MSSAIATGPAEGFLTALALGERDAVEEVYRRYGERVARMVRRRLGSSLRARMETADVAQDAMLDVMRSAGRLRFDSEAAFLRWIRISVERRIIKAARYWRARRRSRREVPFLEEGQEMDSRAERPSQIVMREETMEQLSAALASLSPSDREVIVSRLLLEMPWAAVAASLGASVEAAQMRFIRARGRLARLLGHATGERR